MAVLRRDMSEDSDIFFDAEVFVLEKRVLDFVRLAFALDLAATFLVGLRHDLADDFDV